MSRAWAVVGLLLFVAGRAIAFYHSGVTAMAGIIVGLLLLLAFDLRTMLPLFLLGTI
jgi:hypothetical protein